MHPTFKVPTNEASEAQQVRGRRLGQDPGSTPKLCAVKTTHAGADVQMLHITISHANFIANEMRWRHSQAVVIKSLTGLDRSPIAAGRTTCGENDLPP